MLDIDPKIRQRVLDGFNQAKTGDKYPFLEEMARAVQDRELRLSLPRVVCLCGSTRFYLQFMQENFRFTMQGLIVLSVGFYPHAQDIMHEHGETKGITPEDKIKLDELHKRKIDLADWVYVINVGGYIGDSTRSEINYALSIHKPVRYREGPLAIGS